MIFRMIEVADIFVDACLRNEAGELMFLSFYGRDTSVQQLKARIQLGRHEQGITAFTLRDTESQLSSDNHYIQIGDPNRFELYSGRYSVGNLYNNLCHGFIYDPVLIKPSKSAQSGWVIMEPGSDNNEQMLNNLWQVYKQLSSIPLLDEWKEVVMARVNDCFVTMLKSSTFPPIGRIDGAHLVLESRFETVITDMLRKGEIGINGETYIVEDCPDLDIDLDTAIEIVKPFMSYAQCACMTSLIHGEEGEYFVNKFKEMALLISGMPETYDTREQSNPVATLHYFYGGSDWYITEKDFEDDVTQAYGWAILNGDYQYAESGYICISELIALNVELDLHFKPKLLSKCISRHKEAA